jgi:hypothetical protein
LAGAGRAKGIYTTWWTCQDYLGNQTEGTEGAEGAEGAAGEDKWGNLVV